jgi:lysophospholipase L1-like esterase
VVSAGRTGRAPVRPTALHAVVALLLAIAFTATGLQRPVHAAVVDSSTVNYTAKYALILEAIRKAVRGTASTSTTREGPVSLRPIETRPGGGVALIPVGALANYGDDPNAAVPDVNLVVSVENVYIRGFSTTRNGQTVWFRFSGDNSQDDGSIAQHFPRDAVRLPYTGHYGNGGLNSGHDVRIDRVGLMAAVETLSNASATTAPDSLKVHLARLILALAEGARFPRVQEDVSNALVTVGGHVQTGGLAPYITNWDVMSQDYRHGRTFRSGDLVLSSLVLAAVLRIAYQKVASVKGVPKLAVMPLGDSITLGVGSSPARVGYRPALARALATDVQTVSFVGSQTDADGNRHEGHSGWFIEGISANVEQWLADAKPNVVTLHIGSNNIHHGQNVAGAPAALAGMLDKMFAVAPDLTVLLAPLVPNSNPGKQALVNTFNAALPGIVQERRLKNHKVRLVDFSALGDADLDDRLHPNNSGYQKMADAFHRGMADAATDKWITENVTVTPPPPGSDTPGDYNVDIDGDGRAEYLVLGPNGSVDAYKYSSGTTWTDLGRIANGSAQWSDKQVRFADIDGDRKAEYLVLGPNGSVDAYQYAGGTTWNGLGRIANGSAQWTDKQIRFADIDGDGKAEYLVLGPNGSVDAYKYSSGTTWTDLGRIANGSAQWSDKQVRFADIDGDRKAEYLVLGPNGSVDAYQYAGGTTWNGLGRIANGSAQWSDKQVRFADIDGDRKAEYLVLGPNGSVDAYRHSTGTTWTDLGRIANGSAQWTDKQVRI